MVDMTPEDYKNIRDGYTEEVEHLSDEQLEDAQEFFDVEQSEEKDDE